MDAIWCCNGCTHLSFDVWYQQCFKLMSYMQYHVYVILTWLLPTRGPFLIVNCCQVSKEAILFHHLRTLTCRRQSKPNMTGASNGNDKSHRTDASHIPISQVAVGCLLSCALKQDKMHLLAGCDMFHHLEEPTCTLTSKIWRAFGEGMLKELKLFLHNGEVFGLAMLSHTPLVEGWWRGCGRCRIQGCTCKLNQLNYVGNQNRHLFEDHVTSAISNMELYGIVRNDEKRQVRDGHVVCRIDSTISGTSLYVRVATVQMQLLGVTVGSFLIRGRPRRHKQDPNRVASLLKKRLSSNPAIETLQVFPEMICLFTSCSWIYKILQNLQRNRSEHVSNIHVDVPTGLQGPGVYGGSSSRPKSLSNILDGPAQVYQASL